MTNIGTRIKQLRKKSGMVQSDLGGLMEPKVSATIVSRWESNILTPNTTQLLTIANHFNTSLGWLATGEGTKDKSTPDQLIAKAKELRSTPGGLAVPDRDTFTAIAREIQRQAPGLSYEAMLNIAWAVAENIHGRPEKIEAYVRAELS